MSFLPSISQDGGPEGILEAFPESGHLLLQATQVLLTGQSSLTVQERELIAAFTSGINACTFCYEGHKAIAEAYGIEEDLIKHLVDDLESTTVDEKLKVLLRFVQKLTIESYKIIQEDVDTVLRAGWTEEAFYHAVSICSLFNYYNRLVDAYGLVLSPGFKEHIAQHIKNGGRLADH